MILETFRAIGFLGFLLSSWTTMIVATLPLLPFCFTILVARKLEEILYSILYGAAHFKVEETPWLKDSVKNRTDINGLLMLDGPLHIKTFQDLMNRKLINSRHKDTGRLLYPRATRYVHTGYLNYYWIPEKNFKLEEHVYEWSDNPCRSKSQLQDLVSMLAERPLRTRDNRSPWEFILVRCKDTDGAMKTGIVIRMSHCLADGSSLMYFLINHLCDDSKNNEYLAGPSHQLTCSQRAFIYTKSTALYPYNMLRQVAPQWAKATSLLCPESSLSGKKRYIYTRPISLDLVKMIKTKLNVTVNDVILGCLATSLHNYFRKKNERAPDNFIACVPLDTRLSIEEAKEFGNKINVTMLPLPTSSADSIKNIMEIHERMKVRKESMEAISIRIGLRLAASILPNGLIQQVLRTSIRNSPMVVSNVQGPSHELILSGRKLTSLVFWPPGKDHLGSSVSIMSYNGSIYIGALSDVNILKNPEKLVEDLPLIIMSLAESFVVNKQSLESS